MRIGGTIALALVPVLMAAPVRADEALLGAVARGEAFAIMRHALAPGTGDPDSFDPDDCATQRNLSEQGRRQAREIGDAFRRAGVSRAAVYSSNWCRCRETARLLGLGAVTILPPLNSFFEAWHRRENQTEAIRDWLARYKGPYPVVLVSHQVNISALTGQGTRSGETVVFQRGADGGIRVTGSF